MVLPFWSTHSPWIAASRSSWSRPAGHAGSSGARRATGRALTPPPRAVAEPQQLAELHQLQRSLAAAHVARRALGRRAHRATARGAQHLRHPAPRRARPAALWGAWTGLPGARQPRRKPCAHARTPLSRPRWALLLGLLLRSSFLLVCLAARPPARLCGRHGRCRRRPPPSLASRACRVCACAARASRPWHSCPTARSSCPQWPTCRRRAPTSTRASARAPPGRGEQSIAATRRERTQAACRGHGFRKLDPK